MPNLLRNIPGLFFIRIELSTKRNEEMQLAYKTLSSENALLVSQNKKLKSSVDSLERECAKFKENERRKFTENNKAQQKLNVEKQNSRKNQAAVQQKVTQLEHALKKKEKEAQVLKERVDSLLASKLKPQTQKSSLASSVQPPSIEILNDNKPKRARWMINTISCENCAKMETLNFIVSNLEEKQRLLLNENSELRNAFFKIEDKLQMKNVKDNTETETSLEQQVKVKSKFAEMPFDLIQEDLFNAIATKIDHLKKEQKIDCCAELPFMEEVSVAKAPNKEPHPVDSIKNHSDKLISSKINSERSSSLSNNSLLTDDEESSLH